MSLHIAGTGWVTPLGSGVEEVWARLLDGETAVADKVSSPLGSDYPVFRVPPQALVKAPPHPRLRRSSAISRFAAVAGLEALATASITLTPETARRTALIFAVSNGGVVYTKRFYQEIVESGAQAASPLLFPETVFNAPASHLAAILGITGASYTLVGDGAVGMLALKMAEDLMLADTLDYCLVVGAEEADWLLCDAYRKWRLLRAAPPIEPFHRPARGMILSEGAGAVLLAREGSIEIQQIAAGTNFRGQRDAAMAVQQTMAELCVEPSDLLVASANGTFIDAAEQAAIAAHCPGACVYAMKGVLGESVGASSLWQTIVGAQALRTQDVPGREKPAPILSAVVSCCGLNQQVAGLRLSVRT
ncbi:MAG TPA: beta-ketoacyl synthase N-terminal-like domain-containing protein [Chthoniobacterales bacterium]|jgi:3-oxoacyl-(acyl-carrier-protein) synthase|nr:beta-ketoacyl synthase N-terminal-like domain-containing protein [Chthoniobacterales bacterium]